MGISLENSKSAIEPLQIKRLKILPLILFIILPVLCTEAQTVIGTEFAKGQIIEKIEIAETGGQSFALYLPNNYEKSKKFPTLYCFDPMARGKVAVERFQKAAEKYGYIVIASNDSQNGLESAVLSKILSNLWNVTHENFPIDANRTYAAGFSGGARVAAGFGLLCKDCFFGVIGSGAGFPTDQRVSDKMPFVYFGAVGVDDYNYPEMRDLGEALEKASAFYRIETFDGRHQWLDETRADEALAWFEILAMRAGRREKDEKFITKIFEYETAKAGRFLNEKNFLEAFQTLKRLIADFGAWRDVSKFENLLKNLKQLRRNQKCRQSRAKTISKTAEKCFGTFQPPCETFDRRRTPFRASGNPADDRSFKKNFQSRNRQRGTPHRPPFAQLRFCRSL